MGNGILSPLHMRLITRHTLEVGQEFYSVAVSAHRGLPEARPGTAKSGVRSPGPSSSRMNGRISGSGANRSWLASWLTHEEFRSKAAVLKRRDAGLSIYPHLYQSAPGANLNPLSGLLEKRITWEAGKKG